MTRLLVVETSPRGAGSISRTMTRRFVAEWRRAHPGGDVVERDLTLTPLSFVTASWLDAYFTPAEAHTPEMRGALRLSDDLVGELIAADHLAISTPVYNYNVPASLKAWIDHIVRKGLTLGHDGSGLLTEKRATVLMASGGVYAEGSPIAARDVATRYLRLILGVIGIDDVTVVAGGGAKAVDMGQQTMDGFVAGFEAEIRAAAASRLVTA